MYRFTGARVLSTVMMKTLLFFTICLVNGHMSDAAEAVTGITGGSVIINYVYKPETYKEHAKLFCKMMGSECTTMTEVKNDLWIPEERFSMTDNKSLGLISVLIRNLTINDSGTYRCEADGESFQEVKLDVKQESCCGSPEEQTAFLGETAVIRCKYPEKYKDHLKELYKVQNGSLHPYFTRESNPRFSLDESKQEHVFTVTIANVNRHDDGVYFCGAYLINYSTKIIYSLLSTEIQLHVTEQTDASVQSDFSMIIIISVCVILLLIGGFTLTVWKLRHERQGDVHSQLPTIPSDGILYTAVSFREHERSRFINKEVYTTVIYHTRLNYTQKNDSV